MARQRRAWRQRMAQVKAIVGLDDPGGYRRPGMARMLTHLHEFPAQCQQAWEKARGVTLPDTYRDIDKVVILGMGASAIGGEMAKSLALAEGKLPVLVHQDYGLPSYVGEGTLLIASSYSGDTEEVLDSFTEAISTPAKKLVITCGGRLGALARKNHLPMLQIDYQAVPRAAFPHSFIPLLHILPQVGALPDQSTAAEELFRSLPALVDCLHEDIPLAANPAKKLAEKLHGSAAVVYGAGPLAPVARRWKTQLNENSKVWAQFEVIPELTHNAVVGYEWADSVRDALFVVLLCASLLHPRILLQYEAITDLLARSGVQHELVWAAGESTLVQMIATVLLGDYVSLYLALLNGSDPCHVAAIDHVKQRLNHFSAEGMRD